MTAGLPDLPGLSDARPVGGGSICEVWRARLEGRDVVVKRTPYPAEVEADGLRALGRAGAPVPEVVTSHDDVLVLEHVDGPADWARLGRAVAGLHRQTGPSFGWHRDNLIGELAQENTQHEHWPTFYAERRIRPLLGAPALSSVVRQRLERALDGPLLELLDTKPPASLIHGDLWSGNVVGGRWLIDPAVNHADRELELAFAALFGGFPDAFFEAYEREWPLAEGWRRRRPALQLYHLLVHVAHFGSAYLAPVAARLDALSW